MKGGGGPMELEVLRKDENSRLIKVGGEDHTLTNLLRVELYEDENVTAASYTIDHPLTGTPEFFVRTKDKSPERALASAADRVVGKLEEMKRLLQKALKEK
jgi:DNA-directed RNA polymerase subunit L